MIKTTLTFNYYFSFDFDRGCGRLHGLIRACVIEILAFNNVVPINVVINDHSSDIKWVFFVYLCWSILTKNKV